MINGRVNIGKYRNAPKTSDKICGKKSLTL